MKDNGPVAQMEERLVYTEDVAGSIPAGPTKTCSKCKITKEASAFSYRDGEKRSLSSWCKACLSGHNSEIYRTSAKRRATNAKDGGSNPSRVANYRSRLVVRPEPPNLVTWVRILPSAPLLVDVSSCAFSLTANGGGLGGSRTLRHRPSVS